MLQWEVTSSISSLVFVITRTSYRWLLGTPKTFGVTINFDDSPCSQPRSSTWRTFGFTRVHFDCCARGTAFHCDTGSSSGIAKPDDWSARCSVPSELALLEQTLFRIRPAGETKRERKKIMAAKTQHDYAVYLFEQGFYADAITQLDELLQEQETGERWSDWATAHFALRHYAEAERGFRRALELSPDLSDAAVNFGTLLVSLSRWREAIDTLEGAMPKLRPEGQAAVRALIEQCRAQTAVALSDSAAR
jgi:hypothetical protein